MKWAYFFAVLRFVLIVFWLIYALIAVLVEGDFTRGIWGLAWVIVLQTGGE